jgi:pyruvate/2-oxoglutarate dehydrogenase complex dihydrolipoamide dehydrogenase (E3) component
MENLYDITVIGAGPAGIIAISEFLDVETLRIAWIDPQFE